MPAMSDMRTPQELTELKHIHERYEQDYAKYVAKLLAHKAERIDRRFKSKKKSGFETGTLTVKG